MSVLAPLGRYLSRKRHARGFGIHSPFAYAFITKVLGEKNSYYAYTKIERRCSHASRRTEGRRLSPRRLKMVFRLVNFFRPSSVLCVGEIDKALFPALLEPDSSAMLMLLDSKSSAIAEYAGRVNILDSLSARPPAESMLVVIGSVNESNRKAALEAVELAVDTHSPIVMLDAARMSGADVLGRCRALMSRGMIFHNDGSMAIIVPREQLPRQDFRVSL